MVDRDIIDRAGHAARVAVTLSHRGARVGRNVLLRRVRGARAVLWMERLRPLMGIRRQQQIDRRRRVLGPDPRRLLHDQKAAEALARLAAGESVRQVADRFGTSIWCIYDLRLGPHARAPAASGLAVLVFARHAAGLAALLVGRAAGGDDAEDAHRLEAEREPLAAVGRGDVQRR